MGWRITPAEASARIRARSATVISASAALSPVSSAVVTAAAPSIQRSRCRAVSYSRALPIAMPGLGGQHLQQRIVLVGEVPPARFSVR